MKKYFIVIAIFGAISLYLAFINLGFEYEYTGGDAGAVLMSPLSALYQSMYTWYEMCNGGMDGTINLPRLFPFLAVVSGLNFLGISTIIIQRILFSLYIFIPAISMFCLLSYLLKEDFSGRLVVIGLGSFFYAVNHFTMVILSHPVGIGELFVFYLVLPLLFLVFIKGLRGEAQIKQAVLFGLLFMIALPGNLAYAGLVVFLLGFYFLWCLVTQRNYKQMFKFICYAIVFSILFSFWFIVPYGNFILRNSENVGGMFWLGDIGYLKTLSKRNLLKNVLVLCGEVWDNKQDIASLKPLHDSLLYIRLKYVIPVLSFSALLWCRRKKEIGFFFLLAIIMLFLAKGINPPFGGVFIRLYRYVPGFNIYRNAYDKFSMLVAFSYAVLITISLSYLVRYISKKVIRGGVYTVFCAAIIVSSGLFWQGKVLRWPNFLVKIPSRYYEAQQWVSSQKEDSKILTFPMVSRRMKKLSWGYMGVDLFELLFNKPILNYYDLCQNFVETRYWPLEKSHFPIIAKIFNIRYLLLESNHEELVEAKGDFQIERAIKMYQAIFENRLSQFLSKEAVFNGLRLYKVKDKFCLPHIYASVSPVFILGNLRILEALCEGRYLGEKPLLIFSKQNRELIENSEIIGDAGLVATVNKKLSMEFLNKTRSRLIYFMDDTRKEKKYTKRGKVHTKVRRLYMKQRKFYVKENGRYLIRCGLKPKLVYKKGLSSKIIDFFDLKDRINIAKKHNADGSFIIDGLGRLVVSAYFDGDSREDEYIQIKIKDLNIDLAEFPWVVLNYKIEDPVAQVVEMIIGVDVNNDGMVDEYIRGMYRKSPSTEFCDFPHNIYYKVKAKYPDLKKAVVKEVELYPHKYWKIDCSTQKRKKYYRFWIKNIEFCNGYRDRGVMKIENVGFEEPFGDVLISSEDVKVSRELDGLDIDRYPFMELEYKVGNVEDTRLGVILKFINSNSEDIKEIVLKSIFPWQENICKETMDVLGIMRENGLDAKIWTLGRVEFNFYQREATDEKIEVWLKGLRFYGVDYVRAKRFEVNRTIAKIDNHKIQLKRTFRNVRSIKNGVEVSGEVYLEKGLHRFTNLIRNWDPFKLEWVFIEPIVEGPLLTHVGSLPEITFKKINPTKYTVEATARGPFWLVFSESFSKYWKAYAYGLSPRLDLPPADLLPTGKSNRRDKPVGSKSAGGSENDGNGIKLKNHFRVNAYSNGWYVSCDDLQLLCSGEKGEECKIKIVINYAPQFLLKVSMLVSASSVILGLVLLFRKKYRAPRSF